MIAETSSVGVSRARPGLYRTAASASIYLFLQYVTFGASFTPLTELFIQRLCAQEGLDEAHCKPKIDGVTNQKYSDAQKKAAAVSATYALVTGVGPVLTCAVFGCLGDAYGRRLPLLMPIFAAVFQALIWATTESNNWAIALITPFSFCGSIYVSNLAAFSTLADVTQDSAPKARATLFALVEGAIWVGLLLGPVLGGEMAQVLGNQHAFFVPMGFALTNLLVTLLTYQETLELDRRRTFSWRNANPFMSLYMFFETRTTVLLAVVLFFALTAQTGGVAFLSLYSLKVQGGLTKTLLGLFQTTLLGVSVIGLMILMPLLVHCLSLPKIVALSCFDGAVCYILMSLVYQEWQLFAVAGGLVLAACYFPVVRCGMTNTFGKERYGESLAAVGVVEQICSLLGSPIVMGIYQATVRVEFPIGGLTVHSVACVSVAGMYLIAAVAALLLPTIPDETTGEGSMGGSLISNCMDGSVQGLPRLA